MTPSIKSSIKEVDEEFSVKFLKDLLDWDRVILTVIGKTSTLTLCVRLYLLRPLHEDSLWAILKPLKVMLVFLFVSHLVF